MTTTIYSSKDQIIDLAIIPALGGYENDYNLDAIFEQAYTWNCETNAFDQVDEDEFWVIVAANENN